MDFVIVIPLAGLIGLAIFAVVILTIQTTKARNARHDLILQEQTVKLRADVEMLKSKCESRLAQKPAPPLARPAKDHLDATTLLLAQADEAQNETQRNQLVSDANTNIWECFRLLSPSKPQSHGGGANSQKAKQTGFDDGLEINPLTIAIVESWLDP